jgi:hypothetical protein
MFGTTSARAGGDIRFWLHVLAQFRLKIKYQWLSCTQ